MSGYNNLKVGSLLVLILSLCAPSVTAQYWFQSGAIGGQQTQYNQGVSALIETVSASPPTMGSLGYWVGETLSNGAFVQIGYEIPNQTGTYPQNCSPSGCNGTVNLIAGEPVWFWEYFTPGGSSSSFYGEIGPQDSVGSTGTMNRYTANSSNGQWRFYLNGIQIGSANLGASDSGPNEVLALAEYADAYSNSYIMPDVQFKDIGIYSGQRFLFVPIAYSIIGYGAGSEKGLSNPYGVREVGNETNFFEVGSGLPLLDGVELWAGGAHLNVESNYSLTPGTQSGNYLLNTAVNISANQTVQVANGVRAYFVGWTGRGPGSYTGNSLVVRVYMYSNITEIANWETQYCVNVSSQYPAVAGAGWYDSGSTAKLTIISNTIYTGLGQRAVFVSWGNGRSGSALNLSVNSPMQVNVSWQQQYYVNATSQYSKVLGNGWYPANSAATIVLLNSTVYQTPQSRISFFDWSNGSAVSSFTTTVTTPIQITAIYKQQYLVNIKTENNYGEPINVSYLEIGGIQYKPDTFLFANHQYVISYANYKGVNLNANITIKGIESPQAIAVKLPVFNVTLSTKGILGAPLNVSYHIVFRNGTIASGYTGSNGTLSFQNAPFGYAYGNVRFFDQNRTFLVSDGNKTTVTFLDPNTLFYIIALLFAGMLISWEFRRIKRLKHRKVKK
jgi:hypothetical protein